MNKELFVDPDAAASTVFAAAAGEVGTDKAKSMVEPIRLRRQPPSTAWTSP